MKIYRKSASLINLVCVIALLFSICSIFAVAADTNCVSATTEATVKQGDTEFCYVYIDSLESIAALDVAVHFDSTKVKITDVYNIVSCTLYDSVINGSDLRFSYIFDGAGAATKTLLFSFSYQVLDDAEPGETAFDILIGEAYDTSLNDVSVSGSGCSFTINKTETKLSCSMYGTNSVNTKVDGEFSLSYRFSTSQIASGATVITYDPELFEVVDVTNGALLSDKVVDINTDLAGAIYISFVGTQYSSNADFLTVKFRTRKNIAQSSNITLTVTDLYDLELNTIFCSAYTTTANIAYDAEKLDNLPQMMVNAEYYESTGQMRAVIRLSENSKLGAGDFVLRFDPNIITLTTCEKGFAPTFFQINDKKADEGILKFSIISLEDITDEQTVLILTFDAKIRCVEQTAAITISGSMLSDSLTNPIKLNFVGADIALPVQAHNYIGEVTMQPGCAIPGVRTYTCHCGDSYTEEIPATGHQSTHIENARDATCGADGYTGDTVCDDCGVILIYGSVIPSIGHHYTSEVTAPTCTEGGYTTHTCANCGASYTSDHVEALGHKHEAVVTAPTCTEGGYTTYTCHCGDSYVADQTEPMGHSWGEGIVTKEPTTEEEGEKVYTCTTCGETMVETIAKKLPVIYDIPEDNTVTIPENDCFEGGTTVTVEVIEEGETYETVSVVMESVAEKYVAYEFTAVKDDAAVQPNGKLTVTFDIPEGYSDNISVYYMDENGKLIKLDAVVDAQNRTVTVELEHFSTYILADQDSAPKVLLGDVNGDGRINARDARALLRYIAGMVNASEIDLAAADFNGDGRINARDARAILRHIAGID